MNENFTAECDTIKPAEGDAETSRSRHAVNADAQRRREAVALTASGAE